MANQINFKLTTSADLKGVQQLKKELQEVRNLASKTMAGHETSLVGDKDITQLQEVISAANTLEHALQSAYDPKINTVNIQKFNKILKDSKTDINSLSQTLLSIGTTGQKAFLTMSSSLMQMGTAVKKTNKFLNDMATTFKNTVTWGISSAVWNEMVSGAEQAYGYVKNLDSSLN